MKLQSVKSSLYTLTEDLICLSRTAIGTNIINTRQEVISRTIKKKLWIKKKKALPRHDEFCKNGCNSTMHTIMDFLHDPRFSGRHWRLSYEAIVLFLSWDTESKVERNMKLTEVQKHMHQQLSCVYHHVAPLNVSARLRGKLKLIIYLPMSIIS